MKSTRPNRPSHPKLQDSSVTTTAIDAIHIMTNLMTRTSPTKIDE